MSAFGEAPETEPPSADPVTVRLDEILDELAAVVADTTPVRDAARIDRIARLEKHERRKRRYKRPSRCGLPNPRSLNNSPLMCIRMPSGAASPNNRAGLPHLTRHCGAAPQYGAGTVV